MIEPTFDAHGYPTDETLAAIEGWDLPTPGATRDLIAYARAAWNLDYGNWTVTSTEGRTVHVMATGGWSGNESVVGAMESNRMFAMLCWWRSERGGLHEYRVPEETHA